MMNQLACTVRLYMDPACPFAWISYQWLREVERQREVDFSVQIMSLAILNDGTKGYPPEEDRGEESAWRPVRVAAAVEREHGQLGLRSFLETFGQTFHVEGVRPRTAALKTTLGRIDADSLINAADDPAWDSVVRESHSAGVDAVGLPGGTPILHVDDCAAFGPIVNAPPRGAAALELFDGTRALLSNPQFSELKRARPHDIIVE